MTAAERIDELLTRLVRERGVIPADFFTGEGPFGAVSVRTDSLLTVEGTEGSRARFALYERNGGEWEEVLEAEAFVGRNGIGTIKREGDATTPVGVYRLLFDFGILENPGTGQGIEYRRITPQSYYVDDENSPWYNRWVESPPVPREEFASAEHLIELTPHYHYGAVLSQNEACVPGAGSAIFLHCTGPNPYTMGCVAVSEETMAAVLRRQRPQTQILIVGGED
ncbi:MAG: L,D-transpeptidase family protein [Eubacteriales bacterium]|nr:L,D-transpeptidase family protein [Eubacteriales bacterium]